MTENNKRYLIAALWFICGNFCWLSASYLFNPLTSHLIFPTSKLLRIFHLSLGTGSIAFLLYTLSESLIAFLIAFFLAVRTEKKMLWLVVFILGVIGYPLYSTVSYNMAVLNYYGPLPEDTAQFVRAVIETVIADLIMTPLVAWFGITLGNQYRRQHNTAFNPDAE